MTAIRARLPAFPTVIAVLLGLLLLASMAASLRWRVVHDLPLMLYVAFAYDRLGLVPYRDLFEMNAPGAHLFYLAMVRTFGSSDLALRAADLLCLGAVLVATWLALRPLGGRTGAVAASLFGLAYLGLGPNQSLQRDFLVVPPLALALAAAFHPGRLGAGARAFLVGLLFGAAATVRPQALLGLPVLLVYLLRAPASAGRGTRLRALLLATLAVWLAPAAALAWLHSIGALPAFLEMAKSYWPLYAELDGIGRCRSGAELLVSRLYRGLGPSALVWPWMPAVCLGLHLALHRRPRLLPRRAEVQALAGLLAAFWIYAVVAGKLWEYHWIPAHYLAACLTALLVTAPEGHETASERRFHRLVLILVAAIAIRPSPLAVRELVRAPEPLKQGRVELVARLLGERLRPGDTVQPLDVAGGAVHGMLLARARIASRFLYDFHFYHHESHPFIRGLRRELIEGLERRPPRFVVHVGEELAESGEWRPSGPDCGGGFAELEALLERDYAVAAEGEGVRVLERRQEAAR